MIKGTYIKELELSTILQRGDTGEDVERVQEWLCLWKHVDKDWNYQVGIDGDYGPQTANTVLAFQKLFMLDADGVVGPNTWEKLTEPLSAAFGYQPNDLPDSKRELIIEVCNAHLGSVPRELLNKNIGPWVRSYMGGHDGSPWAWCLGFAQTMVDQALSAYNKKITDFMPITYSCDVLGLHGLENKTLLQNKDLRSEQEDTVAEIVRPGDIFLKVKREKVDWVHAGIITAVEGDCFHTVEGNTNDEGAREGYEVCRRIRNYKKQKLDVFRIET